jgi:uncharacterized protein with PQ loop repeat
VSSLLEVSTLVAVSATGLTATFLLPQILRLVRSGDTSGLSGTWAAFGVVTNLAWVVYLGRLGFFVALIAPAMAVVAYGSLLSVLARRALDRNWIRSSVLYGMVIAAVGGWGGIEAIGLLLVLAPLIQLTPGVVAAYRSPSPSGISPTTWVLSAGEAMLWGYYGWLISDFALIGYGLVTGIGSILILGRWMATGPGFRLADSGRT